MNPSTPDDPLSETVEQLRRRKLALIDALTEMIWLKDRHGRYLTANQAVLDFFGKTREAVVGHTDAELFPADIAARHQAQDRQVLTQGIALRLEKRLGTNWYETTLNPWTDADGSVTGIVGITRDITVRLRLEQRLRSLFESSRDGIVYCDLAGHVLDANTAYCSMLGYAREELLNRSFMEFTPERWHAMEDEIIRSQIHGRGYTDEYEKEYLCRDGRVIPVTLRAWIIHDVASGEPTGMWALVQDISGQMHARLEQQRLLEILDSSPDIISQADADGQLLYMNPAGRQLLAWPEGEDAGRYRIADVHPPEVAQRILEEYLPEVMQSGSGVFPTAFLTRDGRHLPVSQLIIAHRDDRGRVTHYSTIARDVAEQTRMIERLALTDKVFTFTDEAIMITDAQNCIISVNRAFTRLTGYSEEEVYGRNPNILSSGRHGPEFYAAMWADITRDGHWQGEIWDRRKDGTVYPKWININAIRDSRDEHVVNYVAVFTDITERKQQEEQIRHIAFHDMLTGLPNRMLLLDRLEQAMAEARRAGDKVALVFLDLDRFKDINDTQGHDVGDLLLKEVAARIQDNVREIDTVARLGGDEFVLILSRVRDLRDPAPVAEKILHALSRPWTHGDKIIYPGSSIGIAIYPDDAENAQDLMKNADTALYHAKRLGRGNFQFFTSELNKAAHERISIEHDLRLGLERGEFELHYQPKIHIETRRVVGCEALLRWRHPARGMVSPATFIPVAEDTGLIVPLGRWVLHEAARQAAEYAGLGFPIRVAVNLSGRQFSDPTLVDALRAMLEETALPLSNYELEITESTLMDGVAHAAETLRTIKRLGVQLAIDDFGTGYSSLAYLKTFAIDKLKIDQSFIRDIHTDPNDAAIVRAVVSLAHELGLQVVAEGVEDEAQLQFLAGLGCDIAQGYYFSKPLPADAFLAFLKAHA